MYYVYIIRSKSYQSFYTGMTSNIERRLDEHNCHHKSTITTKKLSDYELVFCQSFNTRLEARSFEKYLKSGVGREVRNEIIEYIRMGQ